MGERELIPTLELDKAAVTQVLIRHLNDSSMIGRILSNLEQIEDESLLNVIFPWIEYTASRTHHELFLKRESARPIGCTEKVRVILAVASEDEADLIIAANRERLTIQDLFHVCKFVAGDSSSFRFTDTVKHQYGSYIRPKWGVPGWHKAAVFPHSYGIHLTELDSIRFSTEGPTPIVSALCLTLAEYGSRNSRIFIEENDVHTKSMRTGLYDEHRQIHIRDGLLHDDRALNAFDAGIVITDLPDNTYQYSPFLTSLFPVTVSVTKVNGAIRSISIAASETLVHPTVLKQFVDLFYVHLQQAACTNEDSAAARSIRPIPQPEAQFSHEKFAPTRCVSADPDRLDVLARFHTAASAHAERPAVSDSDGSITYAELDRLSDVIAKRLVLSGLKRGDKVIVSLEQTLELVSVLVAVLKAGGTYIPVDPNYPLERISFVIGDSSATHMITRLDALPSEHSIHRISPNQLMQEGHDAALASVTLPAAAPDHAYVIYTSGTSGQPKGVLVPSPNIVSLIDATQSEFKFTHHDVWTLFHSASFDFSVWEMWGCLLSGAHLMVVPRQVARSPYDFYELLVDKQVTVLNQTPSAFYALLKVDAEQRHARLNAIRLVIFGGEALDTYKLANWLERYPVSYCRLVNMYGITETTVHVTFRNILHKDPEFLAKSVGVPLPGWKISIRDEHGNPCLYGMEGEIWVGGAGVSHGYLNREALTKERFITDPKEDQRWYRSGDLGRMRPDGSVDYLGRIDSQVKLRGFRIELDEIRAVIQKLPYVRDVAVILHDGEGVESSQKQIIAFIESSEPIRPDHIRIDLQSKMPEYMIPARTVRIDEIPMTINGKVDRGALMLKLKEPDQDTDANAGNQADAYLSIWSKVLGRTIKEEDNFFKSGGNSLLAVELLSALKKEVDGTLTLRDLYIHSSPKELKDFLSKKSIR